MDAGLMRPHLRTGANMQNSDETLLNTAVDAHRGGRLEEAESVYRQLLQRNSNHFDGLRLLGILHRQIGNQESSIDLLKKAATLRDQSAEIHFELGQTYYVMKEMTMAEASFKRSIEIRPNFQEAHLNLANVYGTCWFLDEAKKHYTEALNQNPNFAAARNNLCAVEAQEERLTTVAEFFKTEPNRDAADKSNASEPPGLESREFLPHLLNRLNLTGTGVEVGVKNGDFSEHLLTHWKGTRLYSVDPWREFPDTEYIDSSNATQSMQDERYRNTIKRLLPFASRSVLWRLTSQEAAELAPDSSLDFCYLDGDHRYEAIRDDIQRWYSKVKPGGFLAGHDFIPDGKYDFGVFGVQRAVYEFLEGKHLPLLLSQEKPFRSWFVMKH